MIGGFFIFSSVQSPLLKVGYYCVVLSTSENCILVVLGAHEHGQRDGERGLDLEGLQVFGAPLHRQHGPQEGEALRAKFKKIIRNLANVVIIKGAALARAQRVQLRGEGRHRRRLGQRGPHQHALPAQRGHGRRAVPQARIAGRDHLPSLHITFYAIQ